MAVASMVHAPSLLAVQTFRGQKNAAANCSPRATAFRVRAAKLPAGLSPGIHGYLPRFLRLIGSRDGYLKNLVQVPRAQPKLSEPFMGFNKTAEVWNSRACMMGLFGTFIVALILNKGVLEIIG